MYIYSSGIRELIKILNTVLERAEGVKLGTAARISVCSLRTILLLRSIPWMMQVETNCFEPFWQLRTPIPPIDHDTFGSPIKNKSKRERYLECRYLGSSHTRSTTNGVGKRRRLKFGKSRFCCWRLFHTQPSFCLWQSVAQRQRQ